jgi:hypothetical protein
MSRANEKHRTRRAFEREAARYILGEAKKIDLKGTDRQVSAVTAVLKSSKQLYRTLSSSATLQECRAALEEKRHAAQEFRAVFGYTWPF